MTGCAYIMYMRCVSVFAYLCLGSTISVLNAANTNLVFHEKIDSNCQQCSEDNEQ